jgi:hypothetical protein
MGALAGVTNNPDQLARGIDRLAATHAHDDVQDLVRLRRL